VSHGPSAPHTFGLYKGRVEPAEHKPRRFRLLLYAELPDRVHAEILSPLGNPQLIVDGGAGNVAVTFVGEGESFVGPATSEVLEDILGVRLTLVELVGALLTGRCDAEGYRLERSAADEPGLPRAIGLTGPSSGLTLELRRLLPLDADPSALGRGVAPAGTRVRPLGDLVLDEGRVEALSTPEEGR
jgi:hypothetical protein